MSLTLTIPEAGATLTVREFTATEQISEPFHVRMVVRGDETTEPEQLIGRTGRFDATTPVSARGGAREASWSGCIIAADDIGGDAKGHRLFEVHLVPAIWALSQNRNHRVFQQLDEVSIAVRVLQEWGLKVELQVDPGRARARKLRVQYAESDLAFVQRNLEEVGVSWSLVCSDAGETVVLRDEPQAAPVSSSLRCVDDTSLDPTFLWATRVVVRRRARPARYVMQDLDHRRPAADSLRVGAQRQDASALEQSLERFHYVPGAFLVESSESDTPVADDRGAARTSQRFAETIVRMRLEAKQARRTVVELDTNDLGVHPGAVVSLLEHDGPELDDPVLVTATTITGTDTSTWHLRCEAVSTTLPYRPAMRTPRRSVDGIESATVVGPVGEEVHTDEFGRVRVQFHWDREGRRDASASCWLPVSQPWAGARYGASFLPRVGQEVLVEFLGGDPDRPVVDGRAFTNLQKAPCTLPEDRSVSVVAKTSSFGGGGGYNEIRADDREGAELLYVQAERDLETLVKREKRDTIGEDHNEAVGRHRTSAVGDTWTFQAHPPPGREKPWPSGLTWDNNMLEIKIGNSSITVYPGAIYINTLDANVNGKTNVLVQSMNGRVGAEGKASVDIHSVGEIRIKTPADILLNCEG